MPDLFTILSTPAGERSHEDCIEIKTMLEEIPFFANLVVPLQTMLSYAQKVTHISATRNDIIARSPDARTFVVHQGSAHLQVIRNGRELEQAVAQAGEMLRTEGIQGNWLVRSTGNSSILAFPQSIAVEIAKYRGYELARNCIALLSKQEIFAQWTKSRLQKLYRKTSFMQTHRNQLIFSEGEASNNIYLIKSGTFKFSTRLQQSKILKYCELSILGEGEMFGAGDLLNHRSRSYNCFCQSAHGELLVIHKTDIEKFFIGETHDTLARLADSKDILHNRRIVQSRQCEERLSRPITVHTELTLPKHRTNSMPLVFDKNPMLRPSRLDSPFGKRQKRLSTSLTMSLAPTPSPTKSFIQQPSPTKSFIWETPKPKKVIECKKRPINLHMAALRDKKRHISPFSKTARLTSSLENSLLRKTKHSMFRRKSTLYS